MPVADQVFIHNGDFESPAAQTNLGTLDGYDTLELKSYGDIIHTLTDDTLVSIDQVELTDSFVNGSRTVDLNASQFGSGILLTAEFVFDPFVDNTEIIKISMGDTSVLNVSNLRFSGLTETASFEITGDASAETIRGTFLNDTILGFDGDDVLSASRGDDTLIGGTGADALDGGTGNDGLFGGAGADFFNGGAGTDTVIYDGLGLRADLLYTGLNTGDAAGDTYVQVENLTGTSHADMLLGDNSDNLMRGEGGDDKLYGRNGNDILQGGSGADSLFGNDGNDVLNGGEDADRLSGGSGSDTADYSDTLSGLRADLLFSSLNTGHALGDTYESIENLTGSNDSDMLLGDNAANTLTGNYGDDTLYGRSGNDRLKGGFGADMLHGGGGEDMADYISATSSIQVSLLQAGTNSGEANGDTYASIENVLGSNFSDTLAGDNSANKIWGASGNDTLVGNGGNDSLYGGNDSDILNGGEGNDRLFGGTGNDTFLSGNGSDFHNGGAGIDGIDHSQSTVGLRADLFYQALNTGQALGDTYTYVENLTGSDFNDTLLGDNDDNILGGLAGADEIYGRDGNDTLIGGADSDILSGGSGSDTASYMHSNTGLRADLYNASFNTDEAAGDSYVSIENLVGSSFDGLLLGDNAANEVSGLDGKDTLYGRGGNDILNGGNGDDFLHGGSGLDRLTGGEGIDTFVFSAGSGVDEVTDFELGTDYINIVIAGATQFSDLTLTKSGGDTVIQVGADKMLLENILPTDLEAGDFLF